MKLTIGNWIFVGILFGLGVFAIIYFAFDENKTGVISSICGTVLVLIIAVIGLSWYNSTTAHGIRSYKDYESNMNNGLNRTITITAEDGRLIYEYSGKVDVEDNENYILFEDEEGKRHIIYYGKLDTVIIEEN